MPSFNLYENSNSFDMILMKALLFHIALSLDENNYLFDKVSAEKHSAFTRFTWKPFEILLDF